MSNCLGKNYIIHSLGLFFQNKIVMCLQSDVNGLREKSGVLIMYFPLSS